MKDFLADKCEQCGVELDNTVIFVVRQYTYPKGSEKTAHVCTGCINDSIKQAHKREKARGNTNTPPLKKFRDNIYAVSSRKFTCGFCERTVYSFSKAPAIKSAYTPDAEYCSESCKRKADREQHQHLKTCKNCSLPFTSKRGDAKYCSAKCRVASKRFTDKFPDLDS